MLGFAKAALVNSSMIWRNSTGFDFKKFLRAGILKNKFLTVMLVPVGQAVASCVMVLLPSITIKVPTVSSSLLVLSSTFATEAMEAKASPRKPIVFILKTSAMLVIFEVAWRSQHIRASVSLIPFPLSIT